MPVPVPLAAPQQRRRAMPFPRRKAEKAWRKTRLLTNDGMLKILCLDVEELLGQHLFEFAEQCVCEFREGDANVHHAT